MTVSLTPELNELVEAQIASGRFSTADEVVGAALHRLDAEDSRSKQTEALNELLAQRVAEANRGNFVTPDELWQELEQRSRDRHADHA